MAQHIFKDIQQGSLPGLKKTLSVYPTAVKTLTQDGRSPLHTAALSGQVVLVKELLSHNAAHDTVDKDGNTPLHLGCKQGSVDVITELLSGPGRKTVLKTKNKAGETPLHVAVRSKHHGVVQKLVEAGARADMKDKTDKTAMDLAEDEAMQQALMPQGQAAAAIRRPAAAAPLEVTNIAARPSAVMPTPKKEAPQPGTPGAGGQPQAQSLLSSMQAELRELGDAVQQLGGRLEELAGSVGQTAGAKGEEGEVRAKQMEDMETRLQWAEGQCKSWSQWEERLAGLKEMAEHQGSTSSQAMSELQASLQEVREEQARLHGSVDELAKQLSGLAQSAMAQRDAGAVAGVAGASQVDAELRAEVAELKAQMAALLAGDPLVQLAALQARAAAEQSDLALLKQRVGALHELNLGDKLEIVQLKLQQLQAPVSQLGQQQADTEGKISTLMQWYTERKDMDQQAPATADTNGRASAHSSAWPGDEEVVRNLEAATASVADQAAKLAEAQEQIQKLQAEVDSLKATSQAPGTPRGPGLAQPGAPPCTPLTPFTPFSPAPEVYGEIDNLRSALSSMRSELVADTGTLRRDMQKTLLELQERYKEQHVELAARESKLMQLRQQTLMEEAEARGRSEVAEVMAQKLEKVENTVESFKYKLEYVEEQLQYLERCLASPGSAAGHHQLGQPPHARGPGPVAESSHHCLASSLPSSTVLQVMGKEISARSMVGHQLQLLLQAPSNTAEAADSGASVPQMPQLAGSSSGPAGHHGATACGSAGPSMMIPLNYLPSNVTTSALARSRPAIVDLLDMGRSVGELVVAQCQQSGAEAGRSTALTYPTSARPTYHHVLRTLSLNPSTAAMSEGQSERATGPRCSQCVVQ